MKPFLIFFALLAIIALMIAAFFAKGTFVMSEPIISAGSGLDNNSAASQQARADDAMRQAQQLEADAHAAAANETAQAQAAGSVLALAAKATAQALGVARTQLAMTADAANFPSTQSAIFAQQTTQAIVAQATVDARAILLAQQQAQIAATTQAVSAQQTEQAIEVKATVDARAMLLVQQQAQTTATAQAMSAQQTAQAIEAKTTAQAMQRENVTAEQEASASQRQSELMAWLIPIVATIAFGLVLLLGAKFIGGLIDAANEKRSLKNQRLALPGALFEAPTESMVFVDDPQTGFARPQLLYTYDSGKTYDSNGSVASHAPVLATETRPVTVNLSTGDKMLADRAEAREEGARFKLAMKLLRDAIDHVGAQSNHIPPTAQMGWQVGTWTIAVAILRPYGVEILPGSDGGTYLVGQYPTLQGLYLAIGERRLTPDPPPAESVAAG